MGRDGTRGRAIGTVAGVLGPAVVALAVWLLGAPREELVSVGDGRGVLFPGSGAAGGAQLLVLIVLLGAATVCAALVLWHRHPGLRRPRGVVVLAGLPALTCAVAAAAATPLAGFLLAPDDSTPAGTLVALPPEAGPLFVGPMIYGETGPSWGAFPPGAGWLVFGAVVAALTVAFLSHFAASPDLAEVSPPDPDGGREA